MANYWLGIMAVALAATLALWIWLVFRADQQRPHPPQESGPRREVIGGSFTAREGGRQVMPDPAAPLVPESGPAVPRQAPSPESAGPAAAAKVPEQRAAPVPEQHSAEQRPAGRSR
jgi:hypothetical protein